VVCAGVVLATVAVILAALAGSSGASDASAIRGAVARFFAGLRAHDAAATCGAITPAFWAAIAQQINGDPSPGSAPLVSRACDRGARELFARAPSGAVPTSTWTIVDVRVGRNTAAGYRTLGTFRDPVGFRRIGATWRIDCCFGAQLEGKPIVTYRMPSGSMLPTLRIGQYVGADNRVLHRRAPRLGEIIVFHPPATYADGCRNRKQGGFTGGQACQPPGRRASVAVFLKRVVGLPGDRISIVDGAVIRNGTPETGARIARCTDPSCNFRTPIRVPAGTYYVLGDNRGASDDSRFWGPVRQAWIIGLVERY
jgi:signal peptidase I